MKLSLKSQKALHMTQNAFYLLFLVSCIADEEFNVFRLIQLNEKDQMIGSQSTALNFQGVHIAGNIFRKVAVLHFDDLL